MGGFIWYCRDLVRYLKTRNEGSAAFLIRLHPKLKDKKDTSGTMSGHYFHQDLFVAQRIFKNNPRKHLDIGSSTYGFVSHVASFREIDVLDIRENKSSVENINFKTIDIMADDLDLSDKYDSVSCLHTVEHFGLGRYNDRVDYEGYRKGLINISKLLFSGGLFYLSTPIGKQTVYFNAHRVFNHKHIIEICEPYYDLLEFHIVDENGDLQLNIPFKTFVSDEKKGRLGIFIFRRKE